MRMRIMTGLCALTALAAHGGLYTDVPKVQARGGLLDEADLRGDQPLHRLAIGLPADQYRGQSLSP